MNIKVKLHPFSSQEKITKLNEDSYEIWIKEKPIQNKANVAMIKFLEKYFNKKARIVKGLKSKNKIIELK